MNQMGRSGGLDDSRIIICVQKISLDEVSSVTRRLRPPDGDGFDSLLRQLAEDVSPKESTRSGQKYSHCVKVGAGGTAINREQCAKGLPSQSAHVPSQCPSRLEG